MYEMVLYCTMRYAIRSGRDSALKKNNIRNSLNNRGCKNIGRCASQDKEQKSCRFFRPWSEKIWWVLGNQVPFRANATVLYV